MFQLYSTKLIVTFLSLAVHFVFDYLCDFKGLATHVAHDFVLLVDLHDNLGRFSHQSIGALRALLVISPAAVLTEKLPTVSILALLWPIDDFLTNSTKEVFVELVY